MVLSWARTNWRAFLPYLQLYPSGVGGLATGLSFLILLELAEMMDFLDGFLVAAGFLALVAAGLALVGAFLALALARRTLAAK